MPFLQHGCITLPFHEALRHALSFGLHTCSGSKVLGGCALTRRLKFKKVFIPSDSDESETHLKLCGPHPPHLAARSILHGYMAHPSAMSICCLSHSRFESRLSCFPWSLPSTLGYQTHQRQHGRGEAFFGEALEDSARRKAVALVSS